MTRREQTIILQIIETWTGPHLSHMPEGTSAVLVSELSDKLYGTGEGLTKPRSPHLQAEYVRFWNIQGDIRKARKGQR